LDFFSFSSNCWYFKRHSFLSGLELGGSPHSRRKSKKVTCRNISIEKNVCLYM
jgi:hypothetical protein